MVEIPLRQLSGVGDARFSNRREGLEVLRDSVFSGYMI